MAGIAPIFYRSRDDPAAAKPSNTIPAGRNYVEGGGAKKQRREPFGHSIHAGVI